jgi:hypothetical protein
VQRFKVRCEQKILVDVEYIVELPEEFVRKVFLTDTDQQVILDRIWDSGVAPLPGAGADAAVGHTIADERVVDWFPVDS